MRCNRPAACVADEPYALGRVKPGLLWSSLLSKGLSNCWGFGGTVQKMRRNRMLNKMNSSCGKISTLLFSLKKEEKKYCAIWTVHNCCTAGTRQVVCRKEKCFFEYQQEAEGTERSEHSQQLSASPRSQHHFDCHEHLQSLPPPAKTAAQVDYSTLGTQRSIILTEKQGDVSQQQGQPAKESRSKINELPLLRCTAAAAEPGEPKGPRVALAVGLLQVCRPGEE